MRRYLATRKKSVNNLKNKDRLKVKLISTEVDGNSGRDIQNNIRNDTKRKPVVMATDS